MPRRVRPKLAPDPGVTEDAKRPLFPRGWTTSNKRRRIPLLLSAILTTCLLARATIAGPVPFDLNLSVPPVIMDSQAPAGCTVAYLIADIANNDVFAVRMRIASAETDTPVDHRLPCPPAIPTRIAARAMDVCSTRAENAKSCVFADMGRGFEADPDVHSTSENAARCSSDKASDIGIACWSAGKLAVCNVGCGNAPAEAATAARSRCEEKQQRSCPITGSVPVSGP